MKTRDDFHEIEAVKPEDMNQSIIDTTSAPVSFKIGNTYQYYNHKFSLWARGKWKTEVHKEKGARTVYEVSFDGNTAEKMYLDSEGIKKRIGDPRSSRNGGESLNGGKKSSDAKKVPKAPSELANQINAKYSELEKTIREKVGKIPTNAVIESAVDMLCEEIKKACAIRVYEIMNAALREYEMNKARREEIKQTLVTNKLRYAKALDADNDEEIGAIAKMNSQLKAELFLIEQKIAAYEAAQNEGGNSAEASDESNAPALDDNGDADATDNETPAEALDDNGTETPAEAESK